MKNSYTQDDVINLKSIYNKLASNYLYFILSIGICLLIALAVYHVLPPKYEAFTTLQLKDQSIYEKGTARGKFISGFELLDRDPELEDEIGILSSYSIVENALKKLDLKVSCFSYSQNLGPIGKRLEKEIYQEKIFIHLDQEQPQVLFQPIYLTFTDSTHYTLEADIQDGSIYDFKHSQFIQDNVTIKIKKKGVIGKWIKTPYFSFQVETDSLFDIDKNDSYYFIVQNLETLTKEYGNKINISPISKESNIVKISCRGRVPKKEMDFLNALASTYIANEFSKKEQLGLQTINFIDSQLELVYDSLFHAESNLKSFRASNQIIDISVTAQNLNQQFQDLEKQRAELRVHHDFYAYIQDYLRENHEAIDLLAPSSIGINDPFLNSLLIKLSELHRDKIDKSYSSQPNSPVTKLLESKITNTKNAILDNVAGLIRSSEIALEENKNRMQGITQKISSLPESERNLININRKFSLNDNIYNYLLEKRAEAGIALASNYPDKSVVDRARLTSKKPVSPNIMLLLIIGLILGTSIPLIGIICHDFLTNKIKDQKEVEKLTNLKILGIIYTFSKPYNKISLDNHIPYAPPMEAFKFLTINIKQLYNLRENKIIGFSSPQQGDGKTFCSINTASMFARSGKKTLYIDADLLKQGKPHNLKYSEDENNNLTHYLSHEKISPFLGVKATGTKNLFMLPAGTFNKNNKVLVHANENKIHQLFEDLKSKFDIIIVDTPPLTLIADYFLLSQFFDINLLIIRDKRTDKRLLEEAIPMVQLHPLKNLGIVYNDVRLSKHKSYELNYYYRHLLKT